MFVRILFELSKVSEAIGTRGKLFGDRDVETLSHEAAGTHLHDLLLVEFALFHEL